LVGGQVALAFVLLSSVTFLGGSLFQLLNVTPGFGAHGVLAMHVAVPTATYDTGRAVAFYSELTKAVSQRLGSESTAVVNEVPLSGSTRLSLVRREAQGSELEAVVREAGPAYFSIMQIPVLAGRAFDAADNRTAPTRVVISQSAAERL